MRYAQRCTRLEVIGDVAFADLAVHFEPTQIIEICLTMGMSNVINCFRAAFRTEAGAHTREAPLPPCPLAYPYVPED